jgi:hypothetical protein
VDAASDVVGLLIETSAQEVTHVGDLEIKIIGTDQAAHLELQLLLLSPELPDLIEQHLLVDSIGIKFMSWDINGLRDVKSIYNRLWFLLAFGRLFLLLRSLVLDRVNHNLVWGITNFLAANTRTSLK